jgi:hypothetical protein
VSRVQQRLGEGMSDSVVPALISRLIYERILRYRFGYRKLTSIWKRGLPTRDQFLQYLTDLATSATKEVRDFAGDFYCFLAAR